MASAQAEQLPENHTQNYVTILTLKQEHLECPYKIKLAQIKSPCDAYTVLSVYSFPVYDPSAMTGRDPSDVRSYNVACGSISLGEFR